MQIFVSFAFSIVYKCPKSSVVHRDTRLFVIIIYYCLLRVANASESDIDHKSEAQQNTLARLLALYVTYVQSFEISIYVKH